MTGRLVVLPSRSRIFGRSVGYGAATGASVGAILAAMLGLVVSVAALNIGALVLGLLVAAPIAAAVGAVVGIACGLTGGLGLVVFRRHCGTSSGAIRIVAGCGAGLLPTAGLIALAAGPGIRSLPLPTALTVVIVAIAAGLGRRAFYGNPRRQASGPRRAESSPSREIVG